MEVVEVIVPSVGAVAKSVPREENEFLVAATGGLAVDGIVTSAVLLSEVVENDFVAPADGDVRTVVLSGDGDSDDDDQKEGDEKLEHFFFCF